MSLKQKLAQYDPSLPLAQAKTPPSSWYLDESLFKHEQERVFSSAWQMVARVEQVAEAGEFVNVNVAGEPVLIVRDQDHNLRAFYNVCQHHAAAVEPESSGCRKHFTCPYHGWSYKLDGRLFATPGFEGVTCFDKAKNSLKPVRVDIWQRWIFVCLDESSASLAEFMAAISKPFGELKLKHLNFYRQVEYQLACNWKVYVDNFLDGGYHVPVLHKNLSTALDNRQYRIDIEDNYCLQSCPTRDQGGDVASVRTGTARYFWQYPNFMVNLYDAIMGTMRVVPEGAGQCRVIFDYYFDDDHPLIDEAFKLKSIEVANQVQAEDESICLSVQKGLASRAYDTGRLSVQKEAGEHLFHRLLHRDMSLGTDHT